MATWSGVMPAFLPTPACKGPMQLCIINLSFDHNLQQLVVANNQRLLKHMPLWPVCSQRQIGTGAGRQPFLN